MSQFRVGDEVKCVNIFQAREQLLTMLGTYHVTNIDDIGDRVQLRETGDVWWAARRFELATLVATQALDGSTRTRHDANLFAEGAEWQKQKVLDWLKARWPVNISYITSPNENKSVRASSFSPRICSGDI